MVVERNFASLCVILRGHYLSDHMQGMHRKEIRSECDNQHRIVDKQPDHDPVTTYEMALNLSAYLLVGFMMNLLNSYLLYTLQCFHLLEVYIWYATVTCELQMKTAFSTQKNMATSHMHTGILLAASNSLARTQKKEQIRLDRARHASKNEQKTLQYDEGRERGETRWRT